MTKEKREATRMEERAARWTGNHESWVTTERRTAFETMRRQTKTERVIFEIVPLSKDECLKRGSALRPSSSTVVMANAAMMEVMQRRKMTCLRKGRKRGHGFGD